MTKFTLALLSVFLGISQLARAEDGPVRCVQPLEERNFWQVSSSWSGPTRLLSDRKAAWISMTSPAPVRGAPACQGLEPGQKQILSIGFNNPRPRYLVLQALGNDHLIARVKDAFGFPLFTITAEPGDLTGTLVAQAIRLSDGDYELELENKVVNTNLNGRAAGVVASIMDSEGTVLIDTSTEGWCGRIVKDGSVR